MLAFRIPTILSSSLPVQWYFAAALTAVGLLRVHRVSREMRCLQTILRLPSVQTANNNGLSFLGMFSILAGDIRYDISAHYRVIHPKCARQFKYPTQPRRIVVPVVTFRASRTDHEDGFQVEGEGQTAAFSLAKVWQNVSAGSFPGNDVDRCATKSGS